MARYNWQRIERRQRSKWQRHDRDDAWEDGDGGDGDGGDGDDGDSRAPRRSRDSLVDHARSGGMVGSLLFWLAIWAFTGFSSTLFAIFLGVAILQGWSWNTAEGLHKRRRKRRRRDPADATPIGAAPPLDGSAPARPAEGAATAQAPLDPAAHARLIRETAGARSQLSAAASAADGELGNDLRRMDRATRTVVDALEKDPSNLSHVQRMFTYYLPSAAQLLNARREVAGTGNTAHQAEIDGMFARLADAFEDFVARINGTDIRSLEIDLRLLEQSLNAEFDPVKKA